jgi:hypothetical protein
MRMVWRVCAMATVATSVGVAQAELFVTRIGTGAAALTNASTATFIDRFNNDGTPSASPTIALPTEASGSNLAFTNSGTATSEGFIALSADGQYLTLGGYNSATGVASIASSATPAVARVIARVAVSTGAVDTSTGITDTFNGNNIRSVVSSNGTDFWAAGSGQGVRYTTLGSSTTTQINSAAPTNLRVVDIVDNQLYVSAGSGAFQGVGTVGTGLPTTGMNTPTLLTGFPTAAGPSAYDYWFGDANTLYVADDRTSMSNGGIQKWVQETGTWSLKYTLSTSATIGARGLAGQAGEGGNVTLYATTTDNKLVSIADTLSAVTAPGNTFSILATAPTNTAFRGVEFVPGGASPTLNADFDGVGGVNGNDFLIWQQGLGSGTTLAQGDANGSNSVDGADLQVWRDQFPQSMTVASVGAVPEPGSLALAGAALAGVLGVARRRSGR